MTGVPIEEGDKGTEESSIEDRRSCLQWNVADEERMLAVTRQCLGLTDSVQRRAQRVRWNAVLGPGFRLDWARTLVRDQVLTYVAGWIGRPL